MAQRFEDHIAGYKNAELFLQSWIVKQPKATLIVTHGLGEHSECYNRVAPLWNKADLNVYAWDLRGHGRSSGQRGFIDRFDYFEKDLRLIIEQVQKRSEGPYILLGHSLGGLITAKNLIAYGLQGLSAVVLSSPAFGVGMPVPKVKEKASEWILDLVPRLTLSNGIDYKDLVSSHELVAEYYKDSLRHNKISPGLFLGMKAGFVQARKYVNQIELPLLMQLAGREKIVSNHESRQAFAKWGCEKKQLLVYSQSLHEIYQDIEQKQVIEDMINFVDSQLKVKGE